MTQLSAGAAGLVACSVLLISGLGHARHAARTRAAIAAQRFWPRPLPGVVQAALTVAELLLGALGLAVVVLIGNGPALMLTATLVGTLYAAFAVYALALVRWRPQAPCGCSVQPRPASSWTVLRSVALTCLAFAALRLDQPIAFGGAWHATITLMVGIVFALLLWHLPDALAESPLEPS